MSAAEELLTGTFVQGVAGSPGSTVGQCTSMPGEVPAHSVSICGQTGNR